MSLVLSGNGTITGLTAGGLTDAVITADDLASTLDLTDKTVTLPSGTGGKVLQVVTASITSGYSTTSTSFVHATNHSLQLTTTSTNSKILLLCNTPLQVASGAERGQSVFRSSLDSYTANLGRTINVNYAEVNSGWIQSSTLQYLHNPLQSSGTTITYRVYFRRSAGSATVYFPDSWGETYEFSFIAMEIAA